MSGAIGRGLREAEQKIEPRRVAMMRYFLRADPGVDVAAGDAAVLRLHDAAPDPMPGDPAAEDPPRSAHDALAVTPATTLTPDVRVGPTTR